MVIRSYAELRQMLLELLPPSTRLSATEIRQQILDRTESMRIAIDYIIEYIDEPAEAEQFKQAVRERYRRLGQVA